jgi:hypothetical protein
VSPATKLLLVIKKLKLVMIKIMMECNVNLICMGLFYASLITSSEPLSLYQIIIDSLWN